MSERGYWTQGRNKPPGLNHRSKHRPCLGKIMSRGGSNQKIHGTQSLDLLLRILKDSESYTRLVRKWG